MRHDTCAGTEGLLMGSSEGYSLDKSMDARSFSSSIQCMHTQGLLMVETQRMADVHA